MNGNRTTTVAGVLAHIRKRPLMYFSDELPAIVNFLEGFRTACRLLEPDMDYDSIFQQVIVERGWKAGTQAVWQQMQDSGYDSPAVIDELIAIHTQIWEVAFPQPVQTGMKTENE